MTLEQFKKYLKKMPDTPGVYFFLGKNKKILYIGKATVLRDRVRSYFAGDLPATRGALIVSMVQDARTLDWRSTDSVLEAMILEANLIKHYKPQANSMLKDDKSWNYVVITKEEYPRVLVVRGKELASGISLLRRDKQEPYSYAEKSPQVLHTFGPFPQGLQLRAAMKLIRKIFPYHDTCTPHSGRMCFNAQIGLCPGVCAGLISVRDYKKIIRNISLLFQGKKKTLIAMLKREMKAAAKAERFEEAAQLRSQVFALEHIRDISLIKEEFRSPTLAADEAYRIEAYDIAHLRGSSNVGVMTVVENGEAAKAEYRKFRIRAATGGDDTGALKEVLSRRLGHDEWRLPRLIVVDGGTAQINAAERLLKEYGVAIPVVGVVKDDKHRPRDIRGNREIIKGREREILLANAEAHRFAIGYHRKSSRQQFKQVRSGERTIT